MADPVLTPKQVEALLDKLSTDESYRALFQSDLKAAFQSLPGSPSLPPDLEQGCCMMPANLASMAEIAKTRDAILGDWQTKGPLHIFMLEAGKPAQ